LKSILVLAEFLPWPGFLEVHFSGTLALV
jgi:hypothetical protein